MLQRLTTYQQAVQRVRPWVILAIALAAALVAYFGFLGTSYLSASRKIADTEQQIDLIARSLNITSSGEPGVSGGLNVQRQRIEELREIFSFETRDDLLGIVADVANDSSISLLSVSLGDDGERLDEDGITYSIQFMSLLIEGGIQDIDRFMARLLDAAPVVSIVDISVGSLDAVAIANVSLVFHLAPEALDDDTTAGQDS